MTDHKLHLLNYTADKYKDINLEKVLLISCQHLLGTTYAMYEKFFERELKPKNTFIIGKCYSTNKEVFQKFIESGVNVSEYSTAYNSHQSFDEQFQSYIEKFMKEIRESVNFNDFEKVLILDDGGGLLSFANDFLDQYQHIVGVEQTTSGYNKLSDISLNFPVINVARSQAKLETEAEMIAELIVEKLNTHLTENNLNNPSILVIGQGAVGDKITSLLKKDHKVNGCDADTGKCDFNGMYKEHLGEFDVIVGVTGEAALASGDFGRLREGVHLVSASSSDREFSSVYLRRLEEENGDCHKNYEVEGIHLINSGFPINFDGDVHSLAPEKIQLTRSLLLAGVFQALNQEGKGLIDLNTDIQNELLNIF